MITRTIKEVLSNTKLERPAAGRTRAAIAGDHATQLFTRLVDGWGWEYGVNLDIFEADYDQVDSEMLNAGSALHAFDPSFVIIMLCAEKLKQRYYELDQYGRVRFAEKELARIAAIYAAVQGAAGQGEAMHGAARQGEAMQGAAGQQTDSAGKRQVLLSNFVEEDDGVFGHFANKVAGSFLYQVRKINKGLMDLGIEYGNLHIVDVKIIHQRLGDEAFTDRRGYVNASMPFQLDALSLLARNTVGILAALQGKLKKCVVLDLDNTVWGGVIGDDGMENIQIGNLGIGKAYTLFQHWLKELKERGIILAVSSKNTESIAREPFDRHPDMVLRMEDIAVFMANWENKADNIRHIQKILNIGFDAMVFLDDNPVERALVRQSVEGVVVPELPEDPADYVAYLKSLGLFETTSFTANDAVRTSQYREEAARRTGELAFENHDAFLQSLEMEAVVEPFNTYNVPRVAQLIQRSNQFNLRTVRHSEEEVRRMAASEAHICFAVQLKDRFGDYGLISAVILCMEGDGLFIDTWIMSCRVLKRGVEELIVNEMVCRAFEAGAAYLTGEYIPTPKNGLVEFLLRDAGFTADGGRWRLAVATAIPKTHYIHDKRSITVRVE